MNKSLKEMVGLAEASCEASFTKRVPLHLVDRAASVLCIVTTAMEEFESYAA